MLTGVWRKLIPTPMDDFGVQDFGRESAQTNRISKRTRIGRGV
jgi:hypothetical protein